MTNKNDLVVLLQQSPRGIGLAVVACHDNPWAPLARWFMQEGYADPLEEAHKYEVHGFYPEVTDMEGLLVILSYFGGHLNVGGPLL